MVLNPLRCGWLATDLLFETLCPAHASINVPCCVILVEGRAASRGDDGGTDSGGSTGLPWVRTKGTCCIDRLIAR
jgi:hypothetical protein